MSLTDDARFQRALLELYESANSSTVGERILAAVEMLVPSDIYSVTEVSFGNGNITISGVMRPRDHFRTAFSSEEEAYGVLARHAGDHPLGMSEFKNGYEPAATISDRLSTIAFHDTGLYAEFYGRLRVEDQLVLKVSIEPDRGVGIALSRGSRSFSEVHRQRLDRLALHVVQAYRNAKRVTEIETARAVPAEAIRSALEQLGVGRREAEVLMAVATGLSNKCAAAILGISPLTVKKHLENTYVKLGVNSRSGAISHVLRGLGVDLAGGGKRNGGRVTSGNGRP